MSAGEDVLIVEDDRDLAEIMLYILARAGYAARVAENGEQALRAVAAKRPALVLLDILMPVMDGRQCAKELRARYGNSVPIVVVSAAENVSAIREELGADDALAKPFEVRDLLGLVGRYIKIDLEGQCQPRE
jgi:DNA-binding response OmpR family regulator